MANRSLYEVTVQLILAVAVVVIILMCIRMVVGLMPCSHCSSNRAGGGSGSCCYGSSLWSFPG